MYKHTCTYMQKILDYPVFAQWYFVDYGTPIKGKLFNQSLTIKITFAENTIK